MTIWTENGEIKRLVLPCHATPSDILTMEPTQLGMSTLKIEIANEDDHAATCNDDDNRRTVFLTDEAARQLFNALGVHLHRKGPG